MYFVGGLYLSLDKILPCRECHRDPPLHSLLTASRKVRRDFGLVLGSVILNEVGIGFPTARRLASILRIIAGECTYGLGPIVVRLCL